MVKVKTIKNKNNIQKSNTQNKLKNPYYLAYQKYIKSKAFKELRDKALERDEYKCKCCGRTLEEIENSNITLQAHHSSYKNLGKCDESELNDLIILCSVCHHAIHYATSNLNRFSNKTSIKNNLSSNS